jgi:adenylate cyclase
VKRVPAATARGSASVIQSSKGVFLSYASEDAGVAKRICDALRAAGIEVWFDQSELRGGDAWDQEIRQQIRDCALFVPIISARTQTRPEGYFRLEWKLAVDRSHLMAAEKAFLVPVVVDGTTEPEAIVPAQFREVQWTRLQAGEVPAAFVERIAALLDQPIAHHAGGPERGVNPAPTGRLTIVLIALSVAAVVALAIATAMRSGWLGHKPVPKVDAGTASAAVATAPAAIPEKSIAVLPFVDMSERHDQEYFSDGLSEELIDMLTRVPDLRVPARTSSFYFKGKQTTIADIAKALGVAHVLEGSVRKSGKTLRVTAQLINVANGYHMWSQTYDRTLDDIFRVQDSIAKAVVTSLRATMRQQTSTSERRSTNTEAYTAYLRGLYFQYKFTEQDSERSLEALREAVRIDPGFAMAWAAIARTYENEAIMGAMPPGKAHAEARKAVDHALGIEPTLVYVHAQLLAIEWNSFDLSAARAERLRVHELDPNDTTLLNSEAIEAGNSGRVDDMINLYRQAVKRDPLNMRWLESLWGAFMLADRFSEAESTVGEMLAINPGHYGAHCDLGYALLARQKPNAALATMSEESDKDARSSCTASALWALGRRTESDALLAKAKAGYAGTGALNIAVLYALRNDKDEAFKWLDRAYRNREPAMTAMGCFWALVNLRDDPRFATMLRRLNLTS